MVAPTTCASTYVFTAFTLGYFVSDAASVVTFTLLFNLSSLFANCVVTSEVFALSASALFTSAAIASADKS